MSRLALYFLAAFSLLAASCGRVHTLTPVTTETEASLQAELEGIWKLGEGVFHVAFDKAGFGHFAWLEWEDDQFVKSDGRFNAVRSPDDDEKGFISLNPDEEGEEDGGFLFGGFKIVGPDSVLLWDTGELERYESLLDEEDLVGEMKGSGHSRSAFFFDGPELAAQVDEFGEYFNLEDPIIMTRVIPRDHDE
ncbi:MAG: hypothetical protein P1U58_18425 [Verrucomicrobiales bacterium]|nr:hypothetical protein [Verrucomicrobiales bacterium]